MEGDDDEQTKQLKELDTRYQRQEKQYEAMPGSDRGKYLSNRTHYSPTDPDSRIAVKPGKPRELYYNGQIAVIQPIMLSPMLKALQQMAKIAGT